MHFARADFITLIRTNLHDDAFYYFEIARNLVLTGRSTFDGSSLSNGYHPLWMLLILPAFQSTPSLEAPLFVVQAFEVLLVLLAAALLLRLFVNLGGNPQVGLATSSLLLLNPALVLQNLNGLETALVIAASLAWSNWHVICLRRKRLRIQDGLWWGFLAAFAFLSRTDTAPLLLIGVAALLIRHRRTLLPSMKALIPGGILALLIVSPWLGWNMIHFGSPIQSSGYALTAVGYQQVTGQPLLNLWLGRLLESLMLYKLFAFHAGMSVPWVMAWSILLGLGIVADWQSIWQRLRILLRDSAPILVWAPLFISMHHVVRLSVRPWYYNSVIPLVLLALAILIELAYRGAQQRLPAWTLSLMLLLLVGSAVIQGSWQVTADPGYPDQEVMFEGAHAMDALMPAGHSLGMFNAGIAAYSLERPVVNLDGVVNDEVVPYLVEARVADYLAERNICFVADFEEALAPVNESTTQPHVQQVLAIAALRDRQWQGLSLESNNWSCH